MPAKNPKFKTVEEAIDRLIRNVRPGDRVFIGSGAGQPQLLVKGLMERVKWLSDTEFFNTLALGMETFVGSEFTDIVHHNTFFIAPDLRKAVSEGRADYTPIFLSQVPELFKSGKIPLDAALIQVSPPDAHGYCSFGISVDVTKAAAESAKMVIAEVNPQMPRTRGDTFIHVDDIDLLVENDTPLLEYKFREPDEVGRTIGRYAAQLVEDRSTVQTGIGVTSSASIPFLKDKKDLGIHTEMFTDDLIPLMETGAITNEKKTLHRGKIVASFCMGSRRLYDFVDDNPIFEFHPTEYTNDPFVIAKNEKMVAIDAALEVDITGQVCADSLGYHFFSGLGGHADFIRGASLSKGGKSIIVLPSTAMNGKVSRIVSHLSEGAGVIATRGDVHYVITEWGIAYLHGKSIRERAMALINIAHPKFREELLKAAKEHMYVRPDQVALKYASYDQKKYEMTMKTPKGKIYFRPIRFSDGPIIRELYHSVSEETIYTRYFTPLRMTEDRIDKLVNIDYRDEMRIVGTVWEEKIERAVSTGVYIVDHASSMAEFALLIHDDWQNLGVGTSLFEYLIKVAKQNGVRGFKATILAQNRRMLDLVHKSGYKVESHLEEGVYSVSFKFDS